MKAHDVRDGRRGISFSVVVLDCVCVCLKKCGEEYCVLGVRIVNESLKGETGCENREWCVEERGKERYCWRAGVMSRNEGEEEEELFVWTVFLLVNAHSLSRVTSVREGMSVCEERVMRSTLQSDGTRIAE